MSSSEEKVCIHPTDPDLRVEKKKKEKKKLIVISRTTEISANLANVLVIR